MAVYTDDPIGDYDRYDAEIESNLEKRPTCDICGDHIQEEFYFNILGYKICEECMDTSREYIE